MSEVTDGQVVRAGISETWNDCHDVEVMSWNLGWVKLGVFGTSVLSFT